jgi:glycosyltransferase involved in cell wall biosynthesis
MNEFETLHYRRLPKTLRNLLYRPVWRALESWAARRADAVVAVSDAEAEWWERVFPRSAAKIVVVPLEAPVTPARAVLPVPHGGGRLLVFVGNVYAKHNAWAARWLLERFAPTMDAHWRLALIGPGTQGLASLVPSTANVELHGEVEAREVDAWISAADLCLAPLRSGAGVKTKILHYVAHTKLVAATPIALEGIEDCPGTIVGPLDDLPYLIHKLLASEETPRERANREVAQQAWLESHHGREQTIDGWSAVLGRVGALRG